MLFDQSLGFANHTANREFLSGGGSCLAGFDPLGVEFCDLVGLDSFNRTLPEQGYAQQAEADPSKQGNESGSFLHDIKLFQNHFTLVFTERA